MGTSELARAIEDVKRLPFRRESTRDYVLELLERRSQAYNTRKRIPKPRYVPGTAPLAPVSRLKKELDRVFSIFIRSRDSDENGMGRCVTCGHPGHWRTMDCGHFQPRQDLNTRWDERNCHLQCKGCNGPRGGEQVRMAEYIDRTYGAGYSDVLKAKARMPLKLDRAKLNLWIQDYKRKIGEA